MTDDQPPVPRDQAIANAGTWLADLADDLDARSPRDVAENSNAVRSGEMTVDEVEDLIRVQRGMPPLRRRDTAA